MDEYLRMAADLELDGFVEGSAEDHTLGLLASFSPSFSGICLPFHFPDKVRALLQHTAPMRKTVRLG